MRSEVQVTDDERTLLGDLVTSALQAIRDIQQYLAGPIAPDEEVWRWPLYAAEDEDGQGGGIWCADDDCPLQAESSEIGGFREGTFTLTELHAAIGEHIAERREREEWAND